MWSRLDHLTQREVLEPSPFEGLTSYGLGVQKGRGLRATLPQRPKATNNQKAQAEAL